MTRFGNVTINNRKLFKPDGSVLQAGDLQSGRVYEIREDGSGDLRVALPARNRKQRRRGVSDIGSSHHGKGELSEND